MCHCYTHSHTTTTTTRPAAVCAALPQQPEACSSPLVSCPFSFLKYFLCFLNPFVTLAALKRKTTVRETRPTTHRKTAQPITEQRQCVSKLCVAVRVTMVCVCVAVCVTMVSVRLLVNNRLQTEEQVSSLRRCQRTQHEENTPTHHPPIFGLQHHPPHPALSSVFYLNSAHGGGGVLVRGRGHTELGGGRSYLCGPPSVAPPRCVAALSAWPPAGGAPLWRRHTLWLQADRHPEVRAVVVQ